MDLMLSLEKGLYDLLHRISADYELDYEELCERYMSAPAPKRRGSVKASAESEACACKGKTAKGQACKKKAVTGSEYCKTHEPKDSEESEGETEVRMCKGKTAKGQACKKKAADGCDFCKIHAPKETLEEDETEEAVARVCKGVTGKKKPCKKKAADGCDYCAAHKDSGPFKLPGGETHTHEAGEYSEDCDACSQYGDPVNSPVTKRSYRIVTRGAALKARVAEEEPEEDLDDDMSAYAEELQREMEAQGIL